MKKLGAYLSHSRTLAQIHISADQDKGCYQYYSDRKKIPGL